MGKEDLRPTEIAPNQVKHEFLIGEGRCTASYIGVLAARAYVFCCALIGMLHLVSLRHEFVETPRLSAFLNSVAVLLAACIVMSLFVWLLLLLCGMRAVVIDNSGVSSYHVSRKGGRRRKPTTYIPWKDIDRIEVDLVGGKIWRLLIWGVGTGPIEIDGYFDTVGILACVDSLRPENLDISTHTRGRLRGWVEIVATGALIGGLLGATTGL